MTVFKLNIHCFGGLLLHQLEDPSPGDEQRVLSIVSDQIPFYRAPKLRVFRFVSAELLLLIILSGEL